MNTKRAIEFLLSPVIGDYAQIDKIIELLKHGEKYEAIWDELYKKYGGFSINIFGDPDLLEKTMNVVKQKYFPKLTKKKITIEIEGEDNVDLQLATVIMKKAVDDFHIPGIDFKMKEDDQNEMEQKRR